MGSENFQNLYSNLFLPQAYLFPIYCHPLLNIIFASTMGFLSTTAQMDFKSMQKPWVSWNILALQTNL